MKASKTLWLKRIVIGAAVAALPQVLLARGPDDVPPPHPLYPPDFVEHGAAPGMAQGLSLLHGVELSEAQEDAVFELIHAKIPAQRTLERKAAKALDELHRLSTSERFDTRQARTLADTYAQAQAQLSFNQAELDSKLRALLTPEQRQQLDAPRHERPGPRPARH